MLTTYMLHREGECESSDMLARFIERVQAIELPEGRTLPPLEPDPQQEIEP